MSQKQEKKATTNPLTQGAKVGSSVSVGDVSVTAESEIEAIDKTLGRVREVAQKQTRRYICSCGRPYCRYIPDGRWRVVPVDPGDPRYDLATGEGPEEFSANIEVAKSNEAKARIKHPGPAQRGY